MSKKELHIDDYFKEKVKSQQINGAIPSFDDFLSNSGVENLVNSVSSAEAGSSVSSSVTQSISVSTKAIIASATVATAVGVGCLAYFSNKKEPAKFPEENITETTLPEKKSNTIEEPTIPQTEQQEIITPEPAQIQPSSIVQEKQKPQIIKESPKTSSSPEEKPIQEITTPVKEEKIVETPDTAITVPKTVDSIIKPDTIIKVTPTPRPRPKSKYKKKSKQKPSSGFNLFEKAD